MVRVLDVGGCQRSPIRLIAACLEDEVDTGEIYAIDKAVDGTDDRRREQSSGGELDAFLYLGTCTGYRDLFPGLDDFAVFVFLDGVNVDVVRLTALVEDAVEQKAVGHCRDSRHAQK